MRLLAIIRGRYEADKPRAAGGRPVTERERLAARISARAREARARGAH